MRRVSSAGALGVGVLIGVAISFGAWHVFGLGGSRGSQRSQGNRANARMESEQTQQLSGAAQNDDASSSMQARVLKELAHQANAETLSDSAIKVNAWAKKFSNPFAVPCFKAGKAHMGLTHFCSTENDPLHCTKWKKTVFSGTAELAVTDALQQTGVDGPHNVVDAQVFTSGTVLDTGDCMRAWATEVTTPFMDKLVQKVTNTAHKVIKSLKVQGGLSKDSDALMKWNSALFERVTAFVRCQSKTDPSYLEIGTNQGLSMVQMGKLLDSTHLVSLDPYFGGGIYQGSVIGDDTLKIAKGLFEAFGTNVRKHYRMGSFEGLSNMLLEKTRFDLIYIDARHDWTFPMSDLLMSLPLLKDGGVIMLDDWDWIDVYAIKMYCDAHFRSIIETPNIAAYQVFKTEEKAQADTSQPSVMQCANSLVQRRTMRVGHTVGVGKDGS